MTRPRRWARRFALPTCALAAALIAAVSPAAVSAAAAPALDAAPLAYTQNVLPGLPHATDLGPAPADAPLRVVLSLARPDPAGEQALLDAVHDPADPRFGRILSVSQFAERFGVPAQRLAALTRWLAAGGLHVESVSAARDQVSAGGTVAAVSALFRTPIDAFGVDASALPAGLGVDASALPTGLGVDASALPAGLGSAAGGFLANTVAPLVPAGLGVTNVVGLNTLQRMHPPATPRRAQHMCLDTTCTGGTTPADLWSVYEQPPAYTGQGQRVAIFGDGQSDGVIADLRAFEQRFGLSALPVSVKHPAGDTNLSDDAGHLEWNIDTQAAHGMAPGLAGLELYFGENLSDADVAKVFSTYTDDPDSPRQASASYGECETVPVVSPIAGIPLINPFPPPPLAQGLGNNLDATLTGVTRQAALEGKTIFASTGDVGSSCPVVIAPIVGAGNGVLNQGFPVTNSPASLPYVVGVGGTVLYTDGAGHRAREYGWAFGGGGSTLFTPAPSYQRGTAGLALSCLTDPTQVCRGIADVSAQSGDVTGNGYDIVGKGEFLEGGGGGTSLSSPLWAGMWARVQSAAAQPAGLGFANYALYRVGKDPRTYPRDFFDVSSTDPATSLPAGNGLYPTLPGWDYVTGFGTPRVSGLVCDLAHRC